MSHRRRSLPARGAWVETRMAVTVTITPRSLPARGAWVETTRSSGQGLPNPSRSPQGERGLKLQQLVEAQQLEDVAPRKGSVG